MICMKIYNKIVHYKMLRYLEDCENSIAAKQPHGRYSKISFGKFYNYFVHVALVRKDMFIYQGFVFRFRLC